MESAIAVVEDALHEQRSIQPRFKEAQLDALFTTLQKHGEELIKRAETAASGSTRRVDGELSTVLGDIVQYSLRLPKADVWWRQQTKLSHMAGWRELPHGVVVIEANTHHPISSVVTPLTLAICDGNGAVITGMRSGFHDFLASILKTALDQDLFHFFSDLPRELHERAVHVRLTQVEAGEAKPAQPHGFTPAFGPVPVIIDQSCLEGAALPHPLDNPSYRIPSNLKRAARDLREAMAFESGTRQMAAWRSSTSPSYIICHENVRALFQRALAAEGIESYFKVQPVDRINDILSLLPSPTALEYIPLFFCTSADSAIDILNNAQSSQPTNVYVYAQSDFSAYIANQCTARDVVVDGIPTAAITLGPYRRHREMRFTKSKIVELASGRDAPPPSWRSIAGKAIKRREGKRIDFFFSGILLSFGIAASGVVGLTGFGLYKATTFALRRYWRM